jgi:DNA-binding LacI/PurR family transcriptional regulator
MKIDTNLNIPLHCQIGDGILSMIRGGAYKPGDLLFTEVGLCEKYGVSLAPVRQAINNLVAQGVLERRRAKGVFLAPVAEKKLLKPRITFVTPDIGHSFYGSMVRGGEHCARKQGYDIVVANTDFDREKEAAILTELGGMEPHILALCTNGGAECRAALDRLMTQGFILVMIDRHFPDLKVDVVENDNFKIGKDATEYLLHQGHRRIVHLTVEESEALNSRDRRLGYEKAMVEAGLQPQVEVIDYPGDKWDVDNERRTVEWLERQNGNYPTACFVICDTNCVGVIRGLRKMNLRVPEDVSVIGCADLDFARMLSEPLTTINQDSYGMGKRGVQLGIDRLEGKSPAETVKEIHPHKLVERISTREPGEGLISHLQKVKSQKIGSREKTVLT